MAHNINQENGRASTMYVGEEPWHGLGQQLAQPATAAEAISAAGMDWKVVKQPLYAGEGHQHLIPGQYAVVREDHWQKGKTKVLGIVSHTYTALQNAAAFEFFDPIVGEKEAVYHTAGVLGAGERIWLLAKLPDSIRVIGNDITDKYLLLSNSHDGKSSVQIKFTPIRVVCQNTLTMALRDGPTLRAAHKRDLPQRLELARNLLGLVNSRFDKIEEAFKQMASVHIDGRRLNEYLRRVFPDPEKGSDPERFERALRSAEYDRAGAEYLFADGRGNREKGVTGTLWAAYNGVTEYVDRPPDLTRLRNHAAIAKAHDRRLNSIWFGDGYSIKARAYSAAEQGLRAWAN